MPMRPGPPPAPSVVQAFDNPRWSIPLSLSPPNGPAGTLKRVEMADHFRLYVVAFDGTTYHAVAWIEWGTEITFTVAPGRRLGRAGFRAAR
jgi:hypothetical protein